MFTTTTDIIFIICIQKLKKKKNYCVLIVLYLFPSFMYVSSLSQTDICETWPSHFKHTVYSNESITNLLGPEIVGKVNYPTMWAQILALLKT